MTIVLLFTDGCVYFCPFSSVILGLLELTYGDKHDKSLVCQGVGKDRGALHQGRRVKDGY